MITPKVSPQDIEFHRSEAGRLQRVFDFFDKCLSARFLNSTSIKEINIEVPLEFLDLVPSFIIPQYQALGWQEGRPGTAAAIVNTFKKSDNDPRATGDVQIIRFKLPSKT